MKKILIVVSALATVLTTSAFAQTTQRRAQNSIQRPADTVVSGQYVTNDPYIVIESNRVLGRDPDPNIRTQMRHDPVANEY